MKHFIMRTDLFNNPIVKFILSNGDGEKILVAYLKLFCLSEDLSCTGSTLWLPRVRYNKAMIAKYIGEDIKTTGHILAVLDKAGLVTKNSIVDCYVVESIDGDL